MLIIAVTAMVFTFNIADRCLCVCLLQLSDEEVDFSNLREKFVKSKNSKKTNEKLVQSVDVPSL